MIPEAECDDSPLTFYVIKVAFNGFRIRLLLNNELFRIEKRSNPYFKLDGSL